ncbi:LAT2 domain-containing protein isoform X5 [Tachysurus fulvidraco]|uniref:LAT2 domain-containing protein isoform X5 n=1 Tax=Tachysurus fulvidraco TaxID=1234273 RepID=UPI001FEEC09A|nr:LAT2 domain-containing protein isoform X5 [Tachysurus fulvidraco]
MIEVTSQQGAVLAFMSLSTVGFICALCMRCRKKSIMCANQISTNPPESSGNVAHPSYRQLDSVPDLEGSYQNIAKSNRGSMEPTYVDPIATPPDESSALNNDSEYANIYRPQEIKHDSSEDYENTDFLHTHKTDDNDESDYVNIESTN